MLEYVVYLSEEADLEMQMKESLERELELTTQDKDKFIAEFSQEDFDYIVSGWQVSFCSKLSHHPHFPSHGSWLQDALTSFLIKT